jgi:hypothetical protein
MSRVQLLTTNGVAPLIVFDGGRLPIKGDEEESRRRWERVMLMLMMHAAAVATLLQWQC